MLVCNGATHTVQDQSGTVMLVTNAGLHLLYRINQEQSCWSPMLGYKYCRGSIRSSRVGHQCWATLTVEDLSGAVVLVANAGL